MLAMFPNHTATNTNTGAEDITPISLRNSRIGNHWQQLPKAVPCWNDVCAICNYTTTRFSNHITKVLKSWNRFECVFTDIHLSGIQTVRWDTFTFTLLTSKYAFFLQCSFNSRASFYESRGCWSDKELSLHQLLWNTHRTAI